MGHKKDILKEFFYINKKFIMYYKNSINNLVRDYHYDKRYNISTIGSNKDIIKSKYNDSYNYQPLPYEHLSRLIKNLKLKKDDVFIDIGCGKGRVICILGQKRIKKVVGVDINKKLIKIAKDNINSLRFKKTKINSLCKNIIKYKFTDENIFLIYNPFGKKTLKKTLSNIKKSLIRNPRKIKIVYGNPAHEYLFRKTDWLKLKKRIINIEMQIWENNNFINNY